MERGAPVSLTLQKLKNKCSIAASCTVKRQMCGCSISTHEIQGSARSILKANGILTPGQRFAKGREGTSGLPLSGVQPHRCQCVGKTPFFTRPSRRQTQAEPHNTAELQPALSPGLRPERVTDSNGAGEEVWLKGFNLSNYIVEPIVPVCHVERERGKKSPSNTSIQSSVACSHKSANSETDLCLSKATAYFRAGYHTVHRIFKAQL